MTGKKLKIIAAAGAAVAFAIVLLGGNYLVKQAKATSLEESKRRTDAAMTEAQTPPRPAGTLPPLDPVVAPAPTTAPGSSAAPAPSAPVTSMGTDAMVTTDADGNVTVTPNWEKKAANAKFPGTTPAANMGGSGGGKLDLEDGVYTGDHPSETPAPTPVVTPAPTSAPASPEPSEQPIQTPAPSAAPDEPTDTPKSTPVPTPTQKPIPAPTPAPKPSQPNGGGTPKNGDISADGSQMWLDGFGWSPNPGPGVSIPEGGKNTELSGEKIGNM